MAGLVTESEATVRVSGLKELNRALKFADTDFRRELRGSWRAIAEPVRLEAQELALTKISHMAQPKRVAPWSRMRIGITQKLVYIAPREKGRASRANPSLRRPKLVGTMLGKAMEPALKHHEGQIVRGVEKVLDRVADHFNEGV